jgi:hypothetical protein
MVVLQHLNTLVVAHALESFVMQNGMNCMNIHKVIQIVECIIFVMLMTICCIGSLIYCCLYCFIASGGKELRGHYPI